MNTVQIGREFEKKAKKIIKDEGFIILNHSSKDNWHSTYDFVVKKENIEYYIEVRGRKNGRNLNYFFFPSHKVEKLNRLDKEVLILCINQENHFIFNLKEIKSYTKFLKFGKNMLRIITTKKPFISAIPIKEKCEECGKVLKGKSKKHFDLNYKIHQFFCKKKKEEKE